MALRPAVFLDKDGTVLVDVPFNVDPGRMAYAPMAHAGLNRLGAAGVALVVISNQSGVARGLFPLAALEAVRTRLAAMFRAAGARLDGFTVARTIRRAASPATPSSALAASPGRACCCRPPRSLAWTCPRPGSSATSSTTSRPATAPAAAACCWTWATRPNGARGRCGFRMRARPT